MSDLPDQCIDTLILSGYVLCVGDIWHNFETDQDVDPSASGFLTEDPLRSAVRSTPLQWQDC